MRNKGPAGSHVLHLTESGIGDEEVHALAALLRGNTHITELNLRNNTITNEGARALGAVLSGACGLQVIDLRDNCIGDIGIRNLAESLERSSRIRHVYVHAGGKIEALGAVVDERWAHGRGGNSEGSADNGESESSKEAPMMAVSTVCTVDVRNNRDPDAEGENAFDRLSNNNSNAPIRGPNSNTQLVVRSPHQQSPSSGNQHQLVPRQSSAPSPGTIQRRKLSKTEKANRLKRQAKAAKLRAKESGWAGSSGGLTSSGRASAEKTRSPGLPPIGSRGSSRQSSSPSNQRRGASDDKTELSYVDKAKLAAASALPSSTPTKKKKKKKKKDSPFHKRLQNSPLMQMQSGKDKGKNRLAVGKGVR